jgi:hypothetical protein
MNVHMDTLTNEREGKLKHKFDAAFETTQPAKIVTCRHHPRLKKNACSHALSEVSRKDNGSHALSEVSRKDSGSLALSGVSRKDSDSRTQECQEKTLILALRSVKERR